MSTSDGEGDEGALSDIVHQLREATPEDGGDRVSVGDLIDALDERGYGPALTVIPLVELTPIGGIPGVPTLLALSIGVLAVRLLLGYEHFWAPQVLRRRSLKAGRVIASLDWLTPVALRIDKALHERLRPLTGATVQRVAMVVVLMLLVVVPPLELVPFATSGPMVAIALFGLAILFCDGLLMLVAFLAAGAAAGLVGWLVFGTGFLA